MLRKKEEAQGLSPHRSRIKGKYNKITVPKAPRKRLNQASGNASGELLTILHNPNLV